MEYLDLGGYPEVYIDGRADVVFIGKNIRIRFYAWRKIDGAMRPVIVLEMIRPDSSIEPEILARLRSEYAIPDHWKAEGPRAH